MLDDVTDEATRPPGEQAPGGRWPRETLEFGAT
jgi:hypothetical protein